MFKRSCGLLAKKNETGKLLHNNPLSLSLSLTHRNSSVYSMIVSTVASLQVATAVGEMDLC